MLNQNLMTGRRRPGRSVDITSGDEDVNRVD